MSEPLRIAAAVEGPTDSIVVRAILNSVLAECRKRQVDYRRRQIGDKVGARCPVVGLET